MIPIKSCRDAPIRIFAKIKSRVNCAKGLFSDNDNGAGDSIMKVKEVARKTGYNIIYVLFAVSFIEIYSLVPSLSFPDRYPRPVIYLLAPAPNAKKRFIDFRLLHRMKFTPTWGVIEFLPRSSEFRSFHFRSIYPLPSARSTRNEKETADVYIRRIYN